MAESLMSDAEIKRRKKLQGHISQATGTLGLTSLGAFAASKLPGSKRAVKLAPALKRVNTKKAENLALGTSTTGAGIGGAGSFNFAAYTDAEGRKRGPRKTPVTKNFAPSPFEDCFYGTTTEVSKAGDWKTIDQRERTQTRQRKTMRQAGAGVAAGAGIAALGLRGGGGPSAANAGRIVGAHLRGGGTAGQKIQRVGRTLKHHATANPDAGLVMAGTGLAGASAAVGAGAKGGHTYQQHKINQRRRANFKKSAEKSAFGVVHD